MRTFLVTKWEGVTRHCKPASGHAGTGHANEVHTGAVHAGAEEQQGAKDQK